MRDEGDILRKTGLMSTYYMLALGEALGTKQ